MLTGRAMTEAFSCPAGVKAEHDLLPEVVKQQLEAMLAVGNYDAVKLLLLGHSTQHVVGTMAEREGCSRRTARRITARALKVVKADLDKVNIENPELASLLIHQLQEIARRRGTNQLGSI